jgi:hypothetical protein
MRHDNAFRASGENSLVSARKKGLPPSGSTMGKSATRTRSRFFAASCMGSAASLLESSLSRSVCSWAAAQSSYLPPSSSCGPTADWPSRCTAASDHRRIDGSLRRSTKNVSVRGLHRNCNHMASSQPGPFEKFYAALVAKGMRPEMARLTLARKIATIILIVWKRGVCFDAQHLKPQTA